MVGIYSTKTKEFYDTVEAATKAEAEFKANAEKSKTVTIDFNKQKIEELKQNIADVKTKRSKEVSVALTELHDIADKLNTLKARKDRITADMTAINTEADLEIAEFEDKIKEIEKSSSSCSCKEPKNNDLDECSVKVKTFNSETDDDWQTLIDKKGTFEDVEKALTDFLKNNTSKEDLKKAVDSISTDSFKSLKDLLAVFNI